MPDASVEVVPQFVDEALRGDVEHAGLVVIEALDRLRQVAPPIKTSLLRGHCCFLPFVPARARQRVPVWGCVLGLRTASDPSGFIKKTGFGRTGARTNPAVRIGVRNASDLRTKRSN